MQRCAIVCLITVSLVPALCPGAATSPAALTSDTLTAVRLTTDFSSGLIAEPGGDPLATRAQPSVHGTDRAIVGALAGYDGTDEQVVAAGRQGGVISPAMEASGVRADLDGRTEIPEPATVLLVGAGLVGLGLWRRKKAK